MTSLAVAPDGTVWFTELREHKLGRLRDGNLIELQLPRDDARPFGVAVDGEGSVWYTDLTGWLGRVRAGLLNVLPRSERRKELLHLLAHTSPPSGGGKAAL